MARVRTVGWVGQIMPARRGFLVMLVAAVAALALVQTTGGAGAQAVKQIPLNDKQIEGFIAAQKDMTALTEKMQEGKPDPKIQAQLEAVAKKYGFASFAEYDDVAANISLIFSGIDPETKKFSEPREAIQKEIEQVKADKKMSAKEKKQMLDELNEALKNAEPIKFRDNIALVTKYLDKLDAVMN